MADRVIVPKVMQTAAPRVTMPRVLHAVAFPSHRNWRPHYFVRGQWQCAGERSG